MILTPEQEAMLAEELALFLAPSYWEPKNNYTSKRAAMYREKTRRKSKRILRFVLERIEKGVN